MALNPCPSAEVDHDVHDVVTFESRVDRDPPQGLGQRAAYHVAPDGLVPDELRHAQRAVRLGQCGATAGDDAGLKGGPSGRQRIFDAQHAFLELDARRTADADDRDPAGQPGDADVEHVLVGVELGPFTLHFELGDSRVDQVLLAVRSDEGGVVLGGGDPVTRPEVFAGDLTEFDAGVLGDDVTAQRHREVLEFGNATMPEAGGAHDDRLHRLVHVAADEQLQRGAVDVLGDDQERTVGALGHFDGRHDLLHLADLLVGQQDQRIVEHGFHALVVGDHVAGDVAVVELRCRRRR